MNRNSQNQNVFGAAGAGAQPQNQQNPVNRPDLANQSQNGGAQPQAQNQPKIQLQAQAEMPVGASQRPVEGRQASNPGVEAVQFNSAQIGLRRAQEADQAKRKQDADKRKRDLKKRRIFIIVGAVIAVLLIAVVLWAVLGRKPKGEETGSTEGRTENVVAAENDTSRTLAKAREISENGGSPEEVDAFFSDTLADAANADIKEEILLAQATYYFNNGQNAAALEIASQIDEKELEIGGQATLFNLLALLYQWQGNTSLANEFDYRAYEIMLQLDGVEGGNK